MDVEALKEEKTKLEQDLRLSVRDLGEILFQNDELIRENREKNALAGKREISLQELKEKNAAEIAQLSAEDISTFESLAHELKVKEAEHLRLKHFRDRFNALKSENADLQKEINEVTQRASAERFAFGKVN
jgi:hypothetical protein